MGEVNLAVLIVAACVGMPIPLVNLVVLFAVNLAACALLRRGGLRVGMLGVHSEDLPRIGEITGRCVYCWCDLAGNVPGYCPECGIRI